MDDTVVKVIMPEESLPQGIEVKVISAYIIKWIFDECVYYRLGGGQWEIMYL